jgi:hypothetical protein
LAIEDPTEESEEGPTEESEEGLEVAPEICHPHPNHPTEESEEGLDHPTHPTEESEVEHSRSNCEAQHAPTSTTVTAELLTTVTSEMLFHKVRREVVACTGFTAQEWLLMLGPQPQRVQAGRLLPDWAAQPDQDRSGLDKKVEETKKRRQADAEDQKLQPGWIKIAAEIVQQRAAQNQPQEPVGS